MICELPNGHIPTERRCRECGAVATVRSDAGFWCVVHFPLDVTPTSPSEESA